MATLVALALGPALRSAAWLGAASTSLSSAQDPARDSIFSRSTSNSFAAESRGSLWHYSSQGYRIPHRQLSRSRDRFRISCSGASTETSLLDGTSPWPCFFEFSHCLVPWAFSWPQLKLTDVISRERCVTGTLWITTHWWVWLGFCSVHQISFGADKVSECGCEWSAIPFPLLEINNFCCLIFFFLYFNFCGRCVIQKQQFWSCRVYPSPLLR